VPRLPSHVSHSLHPGGTIKTTGRRPVFAIRPLSTGRAPESQHTQRFRLVAFTILILTLGFDISAGADVVAVVSAKSPITTLTKNQVTDIFFGRKRTFPDGSAAVPIDQGEGTAARFEFYTSLAAMSPPQVKAYWARIVFTGRGQSPKIVATDAEAKKALLASTNAIAYIDKRLVDETVRVVLTP
jgi:hypothetical protein